MPISPKDVLPLTRARAQLTELCKEIQEEGGEKIITRHGESCVALIEAHRLDYYHRLEREHIHLVLLEEAVRGMEHASTRKLLSLKKLKSRYGR